MKKQIVGLAVAVMVVSGLITEGRVDAADNEREAVREAAQGFYAALNQLFVGELEPMKAVWLHREDVTYMGPGGGIRHGWKAVLADWEVQAAMKMGGTVERSDMRITIGTNLAVVTDYEIGKNLTADGKPMEVKIRATNVFRKEDGQWKMIGHHTDLLPSLVK